MRIPLVPLLLVLAALALIASLGSGLLRPTQADAGAPSIVYISVSGEGPTAKGWFAGAPPSGMLVQDALDHFAEKGYRVSRISPSLRPMVTIVTDNAQLRQSEDLEHFYVILLER